MIRWTTPDDVITCDVDVTGATSLYVTYRQNGTNVLTKTLNQVTIDANKITAPFSQSDSANFVDGLCEFDVTFLKNGKRYTSQKMHKNITIPNKDEVIS